MWTWKYLNDNRSSLLNLGQRKFVIRFGIFRFGLVLSLVFFIMQFLEDAHISMIKLAIFSGIAMAAGVVWALVMWDRLVKSSADRDF